MSWFYKKVKSLWLADESEPKKLVVLGLDAAGKTTFLYKLVKNSRGGEVETTIPTIGFNVETLLLSKSQYTCWDIGGCDKIRPLWRHYTEGVHLLIFVVDSNDRDRFESAREEFQMFFRDDSLRGVPVLCLANKQDLPNAAGLAEVIHAMQLSLLTDRKWYLLPTCMPSGDGLRECVEAIRCILSSESPPAAIRGMISSATYTPEASNDKPAGVHQPIETEVLDVQAQVAAHEQRKLDLLRESWIAREDGSDEQFLAEVTDGSHAAWDHYTHLRIAHILIRRHGLEQGVPLVEAAIRSFLQHSKRSTPQSYHATMTSFWCHMVAYACMVLGQQPEAGFKDFLAVQLFQHPVLAPLELWSGRAFSKWYSSQLMFSADARATIQPPDLVPLPSLEAAASGQDQDLPPCYQVFV